MPEYIDELMQDLDQYNIKPEQSAHGEEGVLSQALRHITRTGATQLGPAFFGAPADVLKFGASGLRKANEVAESLADKLGLGFLKTPEGYDLPEIPLPTSGNIRKGVKAVGEKFLPDKYLDATTEGEKLSDAFWGDVGAFISPIPKFGKVPFKRALKLSGLMNAASWGTKQLGGGEGAQTAAKIGAIVLENLLGKPWITTHMDSLYDIGHEEIKANPHDTISIKEMEPLLNDIEKEANLGYLSEDKEKALNLVKQIRDKSKKEWVWNEETQTYSPTTKAEGTALSKEVKGSKLGKKGSLNFVPENHLPVNEVWEFKKDMNKIIADLKSSKDFKGTAKRLVGGFKDVLSTYGKKNPRFWEALTEADNIFAGLHEGSRINKFLQKYVTSKNLTSKIALGMLGYHHPLGAAKLAGTAMGARAVVQGFEALKNSSAIRNYYYKIMSKAAAHDSRGIMKDIANFNAAVEKEYPSDSIDNISFEELDNALKAI